VAHEVGAMGLVSDKSDRTIRGMFFFFFLSSVFNGSSVRPHQDLELIVGFHKRFNFVIGNNNQEDPYK
jgi:hypothetical protein